MRRWSTTRGTMTKVLSMVGILSHWSADLGFDFMLGLFPIMPAYRQRKKNSFYYIFWGIISPYYLLGVFICLDYETVLPCCLCGSIGYGVSRRGLFYFCRRADALVWLLCVRALRKTSATPSLAPLIRIHSNHKNLINPHHYQCFDTSFVSSSLIFKKNIF